MRSGRTSSPFPVRAVAMASGRAATIAASNSDHAAASATSARPSRSNPRRVGGEVQREASMLVAGFAGRRHDVRRREDRRGIDVALMEQRREQLLADFVRHLPGDELGTKLREDAGRVGGRAIGVRERAPARIVEGQHD
jgi:hypothetical protein